MLHEGRVMVCPSVEQEGPEAEDGADSPGGRYVLELVEYLEHIGRMWREDTVVKQGVGYRGNARTKGMCILYGFGCVRIISTSTVCIVFILAVRCRFFQCFIIRVLRCWGFWLLLGAGEAGAYLQVSCNPKPTHLYITKFQPSKPL